MRKIWILISLIVVLLMFTGCSIEITDYTEAKAPNWTSDGKIVFIKDYNYVKDRHSLFGTMGNIEGSYEILTLCEVNSDGTGYEEIAEVCRSENHAISIAINSTSSAGDWVTFDLRTEDESVHRICTIRRDGTNFNNTGIEGQYPDFSPDASQIVYEKPDEGIWIMDRDGGNDHQIISDADARYPAWSSDGGRIAYILASNVSSINDSLCISDINGVMIEAFWSRVDDPDWGPSDSNAVSFKNGYFNDGGEGWHHIGIIHLSGGEIDTLNQFRIGDNPKWSPDGGQFIAYDANGYFVIDREGTSKWYLQP